MSTVTGRAGDRTAGGVRPRGIDALRAEGTPWGWTRVGTLDGTNEAVVDPSGVVSPVAGRPTVDWWLSAGKGWVFPAHAPTLRQGLVDGTPVVETRVRVPSGDAVHRVYGIRLASSQGGGEALVVEVSNEGHVPFGLALAVRPFGLRAGVPISQVALDGARLIVDGVPTLLLPRPPDRAIAGCGADGDLSVAVAANQATAATFPPTACPEGLAQAAVIVPVSHGTTFRAVIPLPDAVGAVDPSVAYPAAVPTSTQVVEGWQAHARTLTDVTVPDHRLQALLDSARSALLLAPLERLSAGGATARSSGGLPRWDHVAALVRALNELGLVDRAVELLASSMAELTDDGLSGAAVADALDPARLLIASADVLAVHPDAALAEALAGPTAEILAFTGARRRRRRDRTSAGSADFRLEAATLRAAARVFAQAGDRRAARDADAAATKAETTADVPVGVADDDPVEGAQAADVVRRAAAARGHVLGGEGPSGWRTLDTLLDGLSATVALPARLDVDDAADIADRHCLAATAAVTSLSFALLGHGVPEGARVLEHLPEAWLGEDLEVQGLHTSTGTLGFALRWHGDRPALLWESAAAHDAQPEADFAVTAGLDPAWRGSGRAGDALLAPQAVPEKAPVTGVRIGGLQISSRARPSDR